MNSTSAISHEDSSLLKGINNRDKESFGKLYLLFFDELYYYASKLYDNSKEDACDAIQDVFLALWQTSRNNFPSLTDIKAYLFVSIRNNFKKHLRSNTYKDKFLDYSKYESDRFQADIFETETFSLFHQILGMLPDETAEIFRLFFKGWSVEEIAEKMGKSKQTIYNIRSQALATLRSKLSEEDMYLVVLMLLMSLTRE